ncbi:glycosyl hydrolase family 61-domain-containing protein [Plectosphaerella cucumerina]|uniref:lytic cellulose monooxygenase (C4-dehydrogenating) n=1 Tax=Plectosphaerella cucumerina TaxID=40658 RepID=A0A8K0X535_9PEZI|nr:glycosyl hydrolase family 61-domain-containing protein [Plectosphaerella cucumerina]
MKFTTSVVLAALASSLIIAGKETASNEYVRASTRQTKYNPIKWENVRDGSTPDLEDIRCNQGSFASAGRTKTAEIAAGTKVGFKLAVGATMQHPGPGFAYLSKAPTTAQAYAGDGDWFKIYETGVCDTSKDFTKEAWCTWDKNIIEFDIPKNTPDGEYLLRVEHIGVHGAHVGQAEFYPACAQIKVTGGAASGTPGPTFKLPGGYKKTDPSFNFSLYGGYKPYPMPGPAVWNGAASSGSDAGTPAQPPAAATTLVTRPAAVATSTAAAAAPTAPSAPANPPASGGSCAAKYSQCGGTGFTGAKCCQSGSTCRAANQWYSQCV